MGHLTGTVKTDGVITMSYKQTNKEGNLMTEICTKPTKVMTSGKIRLHESWQWTSGDRSKGNSVLEEV